MEQFIWQFFPSEIHEVTTDTRSCHLTCTYSPTPGVGVTAIPRLHTSRENELQWAQAVTSSSSYPRKFTEKSFIGRICNTLKLEVELDSLCAVLWDDCTWAGTQNYISSGTFGSIMHIDMVWDQRFSTDSEGRVPHSESLMPYPAALCCSFGSKKG